MEATEVDSVITGWETLRVTNLQDFESGEWLILSQWVDEPLTDLPQKNIPLIYQFARNEEERQLFKLGLIKPNNYARALCLATGSTAGSCEGYRGGISESFARSRTACGGRAIQAEYQPNFGCRTAQHDLGRAVDA